MTIKVIFYKTHMKLDDTDKAILRHMQNNGRITNLELAELVNLSPTPCARRVKRLEESGIIDKTVTILKPQMLGLNLIAMVGISMDRHTHDRFITFENAVKNMPEVLECMVVTGQTADFLLKVIVRDMQHYETFLLNKLTKLEGVVGVHSSFVLRDVICRTALDV
ncbi:AsnC family transcriptional regulator [Agaribacter marinus]|uniref:AsnC family transcriptional regulator n=2 Tax=Agaribacter marinus TaxID=1431249 RepID=A0AA37WGW7_9ALTE|nr:AsnC family transcriptional regulator [Agaribacter marinus]